MGCNCGGMKYRRSNTYPTAGSAPVSTPAAPLPVTQEAPLKTPEKVVPKRRGYKIRKP